MNQKINFLIIISLAILFGPLLNSEAALISMWHADGNANDSIGGNNGVLVGSVTYDTGKLGQAFKFDGINSSVVVPDSTSLDLQNNWTLSAWVYTTGMSHSHLGSGQGIISKVGGGGGNYGYQLTIADVPSTYGWPDGKAWFGFNSQGESWPSNVLSAGPVIKNNEWTHIAVTYDNNYERLFVNGFLVQALHVGPKAIVNSGSNLRISLDDNGNVPFEGLIDEIRIYNNAVSHLEILQIAGIVAFDRNSADLTNTYLTTKKGEKVIYVHPANNGKRDYKYHDAVTTEIIDGVSCLKVISVDTFNQWFSIMWLAQDITGNIYVLQYLDTEQETPLLLGQANAFLYMPSTVNVGDIIMGSKEVIEAGVAVPQLSTGLGPYTNCLIAIESDGDLVYLAPGVGIVKKVGLNNQYLSYELKSVIDIVPGDSSGDNKIGLEDAVHALKTVAGQ